jgi:hypothetical protein
VLTELRFWQNNVQTRHVSDVHVIVHMRLQHGPLRARRLRRTLVRNTTQAPWSHQCATPCFESTYRPANARRELQPVRPTASPLDGPHCRKCMPLRDGRDNHTVNERVSMQEVVRDCGSSGRKEDPMLERVSSGPHAGEGFVGTPFRRGFRQDPMLERASSGPHA